MRERFLSDKMNLEETAVDKVNKLFRQSPPAWDQIKTCFEKNQFSKHDLAVMACEAVGECLGEYYDAEYRGEGDINNLNSHYILEVLQYLLDKGLDPNEVLDDATDSAFWDVRWIDTPDVAASAVRLLMEYGADANIRYPRNSETLFEYISFKISCDEYTHDYFHTVQCWLVMMGYGACWDNGEIPLTMLGNHDVSIFKEFEKFDYILEEIPRLGTYAAWRMHIFNKETGEFVAVY